MSKVADVLRKAATDVEQWGIVSGKEPSDIPGTTCAVVAIRNATNIPKGTPMENVAGDARRTLQVLGAFVGVEWEMLAPFWNDCQPSKAVVAAEMRSAADLVDLLYG